MKKLLTIFCFLWLSFSAIAQTGKLRGNVYDKATGQPLAFATIVLRGGANTLAGTTTDLEGFYTIDIEANTYSVTATVVGYDSTTVQIKIGTESITYQSFYLSESSQTLEGVDISARRESRKTEALVSQITVTPTQIKALPSTGGEPDIAQYLPVLPGVIATGDQGGQIYIRGGAPWMNKILLDGMTIYNPFHSIGFFSVFETETIRSAEVLTGGFGAEYGGRVSAIVDLKTREGNKGKWAGMVSASPFLGKFLVEGPLVRLKDENSASVSVLFTGKQSLFDYTSKNLYKYAAPDSLGLPFSFRDFYGKISLVAPGGTKGNIFGFNFTDGVRYEGVADLNWKSVGAGANFTIIPSTTSMIINGAVNYSKYTLELVESNKAPRNTNISSFGILLDFTFYTNKSELKYGAEISGFSTDVSFYNPIGYTFKQNENTTELAGFVKYRRTMGRLVIEPSLRIHNYLALGETRIEPRFAAKINASDKFRIKFAGGLYSQNLISTVSNRDIVNLFNGFLSGPEQDIDRAATPNSTSRLQTAFHAVGGVEVDLTKHLELNVEPYFKNFTQLIDINRTKYRLEESDYITETGKAYGIDFSLRYEKNNTYIWATYSLGYVNRNDGFQEYPTNQDRRHNINFLMTRQFGKGWEFGGRWNFGSGFPFTLTQGFYTAFDFKGGINTNVLSGNPQDIGVIYSQQRNNGRLPAFHRLDVTLKKTVNFSKYNRLEINTSITNAYDRRNIFYFDRVNYRRVNQLPILPSLGVAYHF